MRKSRMISGPVEMVATGEQPATIDCRWSLDDFASPGAGIRITFVALAENPNLVS